MTKRLFTFGCSFTNYNWPTWADILGRQFDYFENWGVSGAGNQYIFNSLIECDIKNKFNEHDTVIVMWSTIAREDRYVNHKWQTHGNIFNQDYYNKNFVQKYVDLRGCLIRDLASIHAISEMFSNRKCKFIMLAMTPLTVWNEYTRDNMQDDAEELLTYYQGTLEKIRPSVYEAIFNNDWWSRPLVDLSRKSLKEVKSTYDQVSGPDWPSFDRFLNNDFDGIQDAIISEMADTSRWDWGKIINGRRRDDSHPIPSEHLEYIDKVLTEFSPDQNTRNWVKQVNDCVRAKKELTNLWQPVKITRW